MINAVQFHHQVVKPTLRLLGVNNHCAEQLLVASAATASGLDPFAQQSGLGIYQISSEQHRHVWDDYLAFLPDLASTVRGIASQRLFLQQPDQELVMNLAYATAISWLRYCQTLGQSPAQIDSQQLQQCWLRCYQQPEQTEQFNHWIKHASLAA